VEANEAIFLEKNSARAYYIRGLIRLDQGKVNAAVSDLGDAVLYGRISDLRTRNEAISLLVKIGAHR
jgi:hypothetical protein